MISDFPVLLDACVLVQAALRPFGIKAKHPDEFLIDLYHLDGEMVVHELHQ
jgi:hypothetical protein